MFSPIDPTQNMLFGGVVVIDSIFSSFFSFLHLTVEVMSPSISEPSVQL